MGVVFGGMAASLDGYIASHTGDLSWLNDSMARGEDYGFTESVERTGAYIIGANTYREMTKMGMSGAGGKTPTYIVTHQTDLKRAGKNTHLYAGDLRELVAQVKSETEKDICVWGGGDVLTQMIDLDLVDEVTISVIPVLLGEGVPFFTKLSKWKQLVLMECKPFKSGIVVLTYRLSNSNS
jgi:dihydrofolate reductase